MSTQDFSLTFKPGTTLSGFSVISANYIPDVAHPTGSLNKEGLPKKAAVYEMAHTCGAKLCFIENEDPDMSFSISFKTPPKDSTGVFHILEHSVLCGSRKFNLKEPFVNLIKNSMQTFLNAVTFPDKTMYPVASTNMQDLLNLTDVYMDAVLFPRLYKNENIFKQEGHHKTINDDGTLEHSGVVLNEMRGAYGDSGSVLFESLTKELFKGTCYEFDSGGEPGVIEKLTYEDYLTQHAQHYRLDNSYIILYGNMDAQKMLAFLDEEYLSKQDEINKWRGQFANAENPRDVSIAKAGQKPFKQIKMQTAEENAIAGCAYSYSSDIQKNIAVNILIDALASSNESPLKAALMATGIGADINFDTVTEMAKPFAIAEVKQPNKKKVAGLQKLIADAVTKITDAGIDKSLLKASIAKTKFAALEKLPSWDSGVDYAMNLMGYWLYDDDAISKIFQTTKIIEELEGKLNTRYFDDLAKEIFVECDHTAFVEIVPCNEAQSEQSIKLSTKEAAEIQKSCDELVAAQQAPDNPEDIQALPHLVLSDIGPVEHRPSLNKETISGTEILTSTLKMPGITYCQLNFPLNNITWEDVPYLSVMCSALSNLETESSNAIELINRIKTLLGNFACTPNIYKTYNKFYEANFMLRVDFSYLTENTTEATKLVTEILQTTKFTNKQMLSVLMEQTKLNFERMLMTAGQMIATTRAFSYISKTGVLQQHLSGVDYYRFLRDTLNNYDQKFEKLSAKLHKLSKNIFSEQPHISICGDDASKQSLVAALPKFAENPNKNTLEVPSPKNLHEGFVVPGSVSYAGINNSALRNCYSLENDANYMLAANICSLEYLWNTVRVQGGAYGVGISASKTGDITGYTYRDPNLQTSIKHIRESFEWLGNAEVSAEELEGYIISSVAKIDAPITSRALFGAMNTKWFTEQPENEREEIRKCLLNASPESVTESTKHMNQVLQEAPSCACASKEMLEKSDFNLVELLS